MAKSFHSGPIHSPALDRAAYELGYINIYWGWLEDALSALISQLAGVTEDIRVAQAITGNADIRDKVRMCSALAFIEKPSREWFEHADKTLKTIDRDIRERRNSFIHAGWYTPRGRLTRLRLKVQFKKPQAFKLPELTTEERRPIKIKEARKLRADILKEVRLLTFLNSYYQHSKTLVGHGVTFREFLREASIIRPLKNKSATPSHRRLTARA